MFVRTFARYVDDPHAMHNVWHWIEFVGNTLVFTLAGCILGIRRGGRTVFAAFSLYTDRKIRIWRKSGASNRRAPLSTSPSEP